MRILFVFVFLLGLVSCEEEKKSSSSNADESNKKDISKSKNDSKKNSIVEIPDENLKKCLLENPEINTNGDNEIQQTEAKSFSGQIDCSLFDIKDPTGILAFTSLTDPDLRP